MRQAKNQPAIEDPPVDLRPLQELVARLRAPDGCPWDQKQTLDDVRAYLIEEAHETAAALDSGNRQDLAEELGDLLFQVVFTGRLAAEEGSFHLQQVAEGIHRKMIDRHPHVFGDADRLSDAKGVVEAWEQRKAEQRKAENRNASALAGVPTSLPALTAAFRLTQKAAGLGFDWSSPQQVLAKVREELEEVEQAMEQDDEGSDAHVAEELGDLLFSIASLSRHLGHDPEAVLARGNTKFRRRFSRLEEIFEQRDDSLPESGLEKMEEIWNEVKTEERQAVTRGAKS